MPIKSPALYSGGLRVHEGSGFHTRAGGFGLMSVQPG
jgi:hypothetical protein